MAQPESIHKQAEAARGYTRAILERINYIIVGKQEPVRMALACLLARGHLLIEDVPGVGKTMLAHTLAKVMGLSFSRIQFTSDMLPADVIGVSVFNNREQRFEFHPGPLFSSVVLADEINRATPKAQSALLEAMEERQVSAEGETHKLPEPFYVIATQNPNEQIGTFPLPESQLDRFLMRINMGYPDPASERMLLKGEDRRALLEQTGAVVGPSHLRQIQRVCEQVHVSEALLDYVQALVAATRSEGWLRYGLSPRAGIAWIRAARAWAFLSDRDLVLPEDIQAVGEAVLSHRLQGSEHGGSGAGADLAQRLLRSVPIP
ncbi:MAG TPA: AAA family ATPase [Arenicellales bacterium]|nr:AAA family ATPase [Arenicellales bacterium]